MARIARLSLLLAITLTITPTSYHVEWSGDGDEVHLIIQSDTSGTPYLAINAFELDEGQHTLDIPRRSLPKGSYTVQAEVWKWYGCPKMCELVPFESSPKLIIHVPN